MLMLEMSWIYDTKAVFNFMCKEIHPMLGRLTFFKAVFLILPSTSSPLQSGQALPPSHGYLISVNIYKIELKTLKSSL